MKRLMIFTVIILMLTPLLVFSGNIPEGLLHEASAQVFFAEVIDYHPSKETPDISVSPVKKIKGDVKIGTHQIYCKPNTIGNFNVKIGNIYLFTYFDENNPTDIFEVTSYDTKTLKIKNIEGDMWARFQKYLNDGKYEKAEHERIDKQNELLVKSQNTITLTEYLKMDDVSFSTSSKCVW